MDETEISLGQATYVLSRVYTGEQTASQLVAERLSQNILEHPAFDEKAERGV